MSLEDPYLDWNVPYNHKHIEKSLLNRNNIEDIEIVAFEQNAQKNKRVCIVEAPPGFWVAWLNYSQIAFPLSAKNSEFQSALDAQKKVVGKEHDGVDFIKVPEISDFLVDSGPASITNAQWLLQNKRRGHPGSSAYLDVRRDDMQSWMTTDRKHAEE